MAVERPANSGVGVENRGREGVAVGAAVPAELSAAAVPSEPLRDRNACTNVPLTVGCVAARRPAPPPPADEAASVARKPA